MIKFAYTILYVEDVKKSIAFYEEAFDFKRKFITPEADYAELISGETTLAFASIRLAKTNLKDGFIQSRVNQQAFGIEIGFITDDIESTLLKASLAGAIVAEKAVKKSWGQTVAYLRDPDGFLIEVCTAIQ